jgi:hypothetical protein
MLTTFNISPFLPAKAHSPEKFLGPKLEEYGGQDLKLNFLLSVCANCQK